MRHPAALLFLLIAPLHCAAAPGSHQCPNNASAWVVSLQGTMEYAPLNHDQWTTLQLNHSICEGSKIRVGRFSRASVLLPNGFVARIDEDTVLIFNSLKSEKPLLMELLEGFVHFISRTPKHLQIDTPIANAGPEGTEFALRVDGHSTSLWVYEGGVKLFNKQGSIRVKPGESAYALRNQTPQARLEIKPEDAVNWALYYPPLLSHLGRSTYPDDNLRTALRDFRSGHTSNALDRLNNFPLEKQTPYFYKVRAALLLTVGRVDLAQLDIDKIIEHDRNDADGLALKSVLMLTQNRKDEAYALAKHAIASDADSATGYSALSYAEQSRFDLDKALTAANQATRLTPNDALAWARKAELELALGLTTESEDAVRQAEKLDPDLERTQTVIGFYRLQKMNADAAIIAFENALKLDSTSPLARLGLGLAKIRRGDLQAGRQDLEIAAALDPNNSLIRSYLGKAYYEENRSPMANEQFKLAKERDPRDPTPYFYDALRKQTENRPVEALHDLQKAIELNDNRAVYRSKQLLDSDRAARGASLARIYDNLGFEQRSIVEATSSLQFDPTNYSAHRFLSDSYINQPGRESAQLSELLQAKLLQPININPVQPHLSVSQRGLLNASGIANSSFQDFTRVFEGNRPQLLVSGVAGNLGTLGDETTLSGIVDKFSYSLGQFHYETDGFRRPYGLNSDKRNTDQTHNVYDAFFQWAINEKLNTQFEFIHRNTKQGSIRQTIKDNFFYSDRDSISENIFRGGVNFMISENDNLILSYIHSNPNAQLNPFPNFLFDKRNKKGVLEFSEVHYKHKDESFNIQAGSNIYSYKESDLGLEDSEFINRLGYSIYSYVNYKFPFNLISTTGLAYDYSNNRSEKLQDYNVFPKVGLLWDISKKIKFRSAYFQGRRKPFSLVQTLEPTQIAGFNQMFDDFFDRKFTYYGAAVDVKNNSQIFSGIEISRRKVLDDTTNKLALRSDTLKAYINWTPLDNIAISSQYKIIKDDRPNSSQLTTHKINIEGSYFDSSGYFSKISGTYVNQTKSEENFDIEQTQTSLNSIFFLLDAAIGFRLPNRLGIIALEAKNLLDKRFRFEDLNIDQNSKFYNPSEFLPQRTYFASLTLSF